MTSPSRYWSDRTVLLFLIALLAVMTLAPLVHSLFTTTDDIFNFAGIGHGWRSPLIFDARRSGRLQHVLDGQLMTLAYGWGIYWLQKTLALASIVVNVLTLFVMVRRISGDARIGALAVVCFFAFVQNTWDHNLLTAYPFILHLALTCFFLSVTAWWIALDPETDPRRARRLRILSAGLYFFSLGVYENFLTYVIVFPALAFLATDGDWRKRGWRALRGPHIPVVVVFLTMAVLFRVFLYTDEGRAFNAAEQYEISLAPARVLRVLQRYAAAALPMHYFRIYRDLIKDFYIGYGTPRPRLFDVFRLFDATWLIRGLIVAFLAASLTATRTVVRQRAALLVIACALVYGSNLPLAVTLKYQGWVIDSYSRGYLTAYFVFFGIVITLVLLADWVVGLAARSRHLGRIAVATVAVAAFVVSYGTDFVNAHVSLTQERMYDRSAGVDAWLASPTFKAMPAGSIVYAPSLWDKLYPGQTQLWDDYWDQHMMHMTHRFTTRVTKGTIQRLPDIHIVHTLEEFKGLAVRPETAGRLYYVKAMQERRSNATYLVTAAIEPTDGSAPLRAREVTVFAHAKADRFTVLGRLLGVDTQCGGRVLVDGVPSSGVFTSSFAAEIDRLRRSEDWMSSRIQGVGGTISPESVVVTDLSEPIGSNVAVEFGDGFYDDEFVHRWAREQATITVQNLSERQVTVDLLVDLHVPSATRQETFPVIATTPMTKAEWAVGTEFQKHSVRVTVPPLGRTPVTFTTTAPRLPKESRALVMMFRMPLRTQEVSCAWPAPIEQARDQDARVVVN